MIAFNLFSQFLMILGGYLFKLAILSDPHLNAFSGSLFRVFINLLFVIGVVCWLAQKPKKIWLHLIGEKPFGLIIWGILGSLTIIFYFITLHHLGVGRSSFLINTHGAMMVAIAPILLKTKFEKIFAVSAAFALVGSYLILISDGPSNGLKDFTYLGTGLGSGLAAALAYIWIGKNHSSESTWSIMFYWSTMATAIHLSMAVLTPIPLPTQTNTWLLLSASGLSASIGQFGVTASFQNKDNLIYGVLGYVGATFALGLDVAIGESSASLNQSLGAALIIGSTVLSIRSNRKKSLNYVDH